MKRIFCALVAAALTAGSMPIPTPGPRADVSPSSKTAGSGCCGSMACCEAGPPCAAGASACAAPKDGGDPSVCSLRALPCGGPSARITVVAVDPMLRPGPAMGIETPEPAGAVAEFDRRADRRATEPAVPPPRS